MHQMRGQLKSTEHDITASTALFSHRVGQTIVICAIKPKTHRIDT